MSEEVQLVATPTPPGSPVAGQSPPLCPGIALAVIWGDVLMGRRGMPQREQWLLLPCPSVSPEPASYHLTLTQTILIACTNDRSIGL